MADGSYLDLGLKKKKRTVLIFDVRVQPQVEVLQGLLVRALRCATFYWRPAAA